MNFIKKIKLAKIENKAVAYPCLYKEMSHY